MRLKTREEIDQPYIDFIEYCGKDFRSILEIDVIIRAKGGNLLELFNRGLLIQNQNRPSYFRVES